MLVVAEAGRGSDANDSSTHCFGSLQLERAPPKESALLQSWTLALPRVRLGALFLLHVSGAARSARMEHAAHSHGAALAIYLGGSALPRCLGLARVAGQLHVAEGGLHTLRFRWPKLAVMRGCD